MINNIVKVKIIGNKTNKYYKDLGYVFNFGDIIEVKLEDVPKGSNVKVDVICDSCEKPFSVTYYNYLNYIKNQNTYFCFKCSRRKTKITNIEKYGVENPMQNNEVKEKGKQTNLKKYGFECSLQNKKIKDKAKKTNQNLYGNENFTNREKFKETCLKKYGVENVFQNENIKNKISATRVKLGIQMFPELRTPFQKYKLIVRRFTQRVKKTFIENWNGYDYYDNEYIIDNYNLKSNDRNYPTIDHKKSVFFGFMNNIPAEEIGSIYNLCITKRYINSSKNVNCNWK